MSVAPFSWPGGAGAVPFPTIFDLRGAHRQLLQHQREGVPLDALTSEVMLFLERARRTGVWLDVDEHREAAQGLIDYWTTTLFRSSIRVEETELADFDPSLAPALDDSLCPYVGLAAFDEQSSDRFFGRERMLKPAMQCLATNRFLAILGPSGSGKSSIVLAGIIPKLRAGGVEGSAEWQYLPPIVPGSDPVANLAAVLKDIGDGGRDARPPTAVLVVDQFEELFTLCDSEEKRNEFAATLFRLVNAETPRRVVLVTMRSDYEMHLAKVPGLQELFEKGELRATPMSAAELRTAIVEPAKRIGLKLESGLVDALVTDVLGEPAALPLLQFTLLRLWQERDRNRITLAAYRKIGGSRTALARTADALYAELIPEDQTIMRKIFLRMVRPASGEETTRRRVRVKDFESMGHAPQNVERVLAMLVESRLVRRSSGEMPVDDQVEVAHEALIRNWPLLVSWLEETRVQLLRLRRFEAMAEEWERFDRRYGFLDEKQVEDAEEWMASEEAAEIGVTETLAAFVVASRNVFVERRRRQLRVRTIVVSGFVILVTVVILVLWIQNETLEDRNDKLIDANTRLNATISELEAKEKENAILAEDVTLSLETAKAEEAEADKAQKEASSNQSVLERTFFSTNPDFNAPRLIATAEKLGLRKSGKLIPIGASIGSDVGGGSGSVCCLVRDVKTGEPFLLTHALAVGLEGSQVVQPGQLDGKGNVIGSVVRVGAQKYRSGALVRLEPGFEIDLSGGRLGPIRSVAENVRVGDDVRMISRGSGLVKGTVIENRGTELVTNFESRADTGAPVVNSRNALVGILYVRAGGTDHSVILPIKPLLKELGVKLVPSGLR